MYQPTRLVSDNLIVAYTAEVEIMGERGNVRSQKVLANSQFPESFAVKFSFHPPQPHQHPGNYFICNVCDENACGLYYIN